MIKKYIFENDTHPYMPLALPNNVSTKVGMSMQIFRIQDVDSIANRAYVYCQIRFYWHDSRLVWRDSDFGGIKKIRVSTDPAFNDDKYIWTPDV